MNDPSDFQGCMKDCNGACNGVKTESSAQTDHLDDWMTALTLNVTGKIELRWHPMSLVLSSPSSQGVSLKHSPVVFCAI